MQFYDVSNAVLRDYWFCVETLRAAAGDKHAQIDAMSDLQDVHRRLAQAQADLSKLLARRAVLKFCSSNPRTSSSFFASQLQAKQLRFLVQLSYTAASEGLDFSLGALGQPRPQATFALERLEDNIASFLTERSTGAEVCDVVFEHCRNLLANAAAFCEDRTRSAHWTIAAQAKEQATLQAIRVQGASSLLLLFANDTRLAQGSTLSVFANEACTELIQSYSSLTDSGPLSPLFVPAAECWLHVTRPQDMPCIGRLKCLPLHHDLTLASWLISFMIRKGLAWSKSAPSLQGGGAVGMCYLFADMLLSSFRVEKMAPSPLKESLLVKVSQLLAQVNSFRAFNKQAEADIGSRTAEPAAELPASPLFRRQASATTSTAKDQTLGALKALNNELVDLFKRESEESSFTSYLQQLLDLVAVSDAQRPVSDRLISKFEFKQPENEDDKRKREAEEEAAKAKAASALWACEICTFENPPSDQACGMCGSPKPRAAPKKAAARAAPKRKAPTAVRLCTT